MTYGEIKERVLTTKDIKPTTTMTNDARIKEIADMINLGIIPETISDYEFVCELSHNHPSDNPEIMSEYGVTSYGQLLPFRNTGVKGWSLKPWASRHYSNHNYIVAEETGGETSLTGKFVSNLQLNRNQELHLKFTSYAYALFCFQMLIQKNTHGTLSVIHFLDIYEEDNGDQILTCNEEKKIGEFVFDDNTYTWYGNQSSPWGVCSDNIINLYVKLHSPASLSLHEGIRYEIKLTSGGVLIPLTYTPATVFGMCAYFNDIKIETLELDKRESLSCIEEIKKQFGVKTLNDLDPTI